jgi:hypothetical protein
VLGAEGTVVVVDGAVVVDASVLVVVAGAVVVVGSAVVVVTRMVVVDDVVSSPAQATRSSPASKMPRIVFVLMLPRFIVQVDRRRAGL